jgi:hypothetical protein
MVKAVQILKKIRYSFYLNFFNKKSIFSGAKILKYLLLLFSLNGQSKKLVTLLLIKNKKIKVKVST